MSPIVKHRGGKSLPVYVCSLCKYQSDRKYNVVRHEVRIHSSSTKVRQCCGRTFSTKGDYYLHCEENHPLSRAAANIISRTKYKIVAGCKISSKISGDVEFSCKIVAEESTKSRYMLRPRSKIEKKWRNYEDDLGDIKSLESLSCGQDTHNEDDQSTTTSSISNSNEDLENRSRNGDDSSSNSVSTRTGSVSYRRSDFTDPLKETVSPLLSSGYETKNWSESTDTTGIDIVESSLIDKSQNGEISELKCHVDFPKFCEKSVNELDNDCSTKIDNFDKFVEFKGIEKSISKISSTSGLAFWDLPIKKRILLDIESNNRVKIEKKSTFCAIKADDRESMKKERKMTKRMRREIERKKSQFESSDEENIARPEFFFRKQKYRRRKMDLDIDVIIDPRIIENIASSQINDYLRDIDFENF